MMNFRNLVIPTKNILSYILFKKGFFFFKIAKFKKINYLIIIVFCRGLVC
jgi:hypothetical protein